MDPPNSSQRLFTRVTRGSVKKEVETPTELVLKGKLNQGGGAGRHRHRAARVKKMNVFGDFGEGSGSDESLSSVDPEIVESVGRSGSSLFPELGASTEPVRRRSRGRPPKNQNAKSPGRPSLGRNDPSGSRERLNRRESYSALRRMSGGVKRKSESMSAEYEIEEILDKYVDRDGITWYLILWKDYEKFDSTWEPQSKLEPDGIEAIHDFENKAQQALTFGEDVREENNLTTIGDTGDNAGAPLPPQRSGIKRFRKALWQTSVNFMYGVITTSIALIGTMTVLAYSYAINFSQDD